MTGRGGGGGRRVLLPPINCIFKLLQSHATVHIWLYEQVRHCRGHSNIMMRLTCYSLQLAIRIEGKIRGFDEFMNLVVSINCPFFSTLRG